MALVSALAIMTVLTVAGAGVSGRPLKHTAWRNSRYRFHHGTSWDIGAAADDEPSAVEQKSKAVDPVAAWQQAKAAIRLRRVA
jgi:hypothetical protein